MGVCEKEDAKGRQTQVASYVKNEKRYHMSEKTKSRIKESDFCCSAAVAVNRWTRPSNIVHSSGLGIAIF